MARNVFYDSVVELMEQYSHIILVYVYTPRVFIGCVSNEVLFWLEWGWKWLCEQRGFVLARMGLGVVVFN